MSYSFGHLPRLRVEQDAAPDSMIHMIGDVDGAEGVLDSLDLRRELRIFRDFDP